MHNRPARSVRLFFLATLVMLAGALIASAANDSDPSGDLLPVRRQRRVLTEREIGGNVDSWFYGGLGGQSPQDAVDTTKTPLGRRVGYSPLPRPHRRDQVEVPGPAFGV